MESPLSSLSPPRQFQVSNQLAFINVFTVEYWDQNIPDLWSSLSILVKSGLWAMFSLLFCNYVRTVRFLWWKDELLVMLTSWQNWWCWLTSWQCWHCRNETLLVMLTLWQNWWCCLTSWWCWYCDIKVMLTLWQIWARLELQLSRRVKIALPGNRRFSWPRLKHSNLTFLQLSSDYKRD